MASMQYYPNQLEARAAKLREAGRDRDAMAIYLHMADGDPSLEAGYLAMQIGACCESLGDLHLARWWYGRAVEENPSINGYVEARQRLEHVGIAVLLNEEIPRRTGSGSLSATRDGVVRWNALNDLPRRIEGIALFRNVGRLIVNADNPRLRAWDEWPGPEVEGSQTIAMRQQHLHDELVPPDAEQTWQSALHAAVDHAAALIPYHSDEDVWHAPTAAAWGAAWTFALECIHLSLKLPVPADLRSQITWYERGHWPCSIREGRSGHDVHEYVIF